MSHHPKLTQCTDSAAHGISTKKATEIRRDKIRKVHPRFVELQSMCERCARKHKMTVVGRNNAYTCPVCEKNGAIIVDCYFG